MTISTPKLDDKTFYDVFNLMDSYKWSRNPKGALVELWNLCDNESQRDLIKDLFSRFTYIDSTQLLDISKNITDQFKAWSFSPPYTYIAAIADKDEIDGSISGLQYMKNKFPSTEGWKEKYFISSITSAAHEINSNSNLILFDDFIGTGKTMIRKYDYLTKKLLERKIKLKSLKIVSFAGMKFGIENILDHAKDVEVYCPKTLKKGISDYETRGKIQERKKIMLLLENNLRSKFKKLNLLDHSLGYRESEALYQLEGYNCPNNIFPVFWWPELENKETRNTLFQRAR